MTDIVYLPGEDLADVVSRQFKSVLMECSELIVPMSGFTVNLLGKKEITFPEVGVDWRTVTLSGNTGSWHPTVFTPEGITAKIQFEQTQTGNVTVSEYSRFSSFVLGRMRDLTVDLFTLFGDAQLSEKKVRHVPLAIPMVDMDNTTVVKYAAGCEVADVVGALLIYGGADQGGVQSVKLEAAKLYRFMRAFKFRFTQRGLANSEFELPKFNTYQGVLYEAVIPFYARVTLESAGMQNQTPLDQSLPLSVESIIDGGTFE